MNVLVVVVLVLLLIGVMPTWQWSAGWGPYPAGILGVVVVILLVLVLLGRL